MNVNDQCYHWTSMMDLILGKMVTVPDATLSVIAEACSPISASPAEFPALHAPNPLLDLHLVLDLLG